MGSSDEAFLMAAFMAKYDEDEDEEDEASSESNISISTITEITKKKKKGRKACNKDLNFYSEQYNEFKTLMRDGRLKETAGSWYDAIVESVGVMMKGMEAFHIEKESERNNNKKRENLV